VVRLALERPRQFRLLVQPELALNEVELLRRDQSAMRDANAVERAVKIDRPEIEKIGELGEARRGHCQSKLA
jgi:hypothetical protein